MGNDVSGFCAKSPGNFRNFSLIKSFLSFSFLSCSCFSFVSASIFFCAISASKAASAFSFCAICAFSAASALAICAYTNHPIPNTSAAVAAAVRKTFFLLRPIHFCARYPALEGRAEIGMLAAYASKSAINASTVA